MLKVLIAEDSVILADILEDYLISQNFKVCGIARTADEAVALADLYKPDLAVLDFRLGDGAYGSQVGARMKDKGNMGILYVSGDPLEKILTRDDGEAYIQKPYGMNDLARALRIVHEIKIKGTVPPDLFPKGFKLLGDSTSGHRKSA